MISSYIHRLALTLVWCTIPSSLHAGIVKEYAQSDKNKQDIQPLENPHYFALFDQGKKHDDIINYLKKYLYSNIFERIKHSSAQSDPQSKIAAFKNTFALIDRAIYQEGYQGGSAALVAYIDEEEQKLYIINVGNGRAVISHNQTAIQLSEDLSTNNEYEKARIRAAGSCVKQDLINPKIFKVNGEIKISRGFGHNKYKNYDRCYTSKNNTYADQHPISPYPKTTSYPLNYDDDFLILASAELWNAITNHAAVTFVKKQLALGFNLTIITQELAQKAPKGDSSVIIIRFDVAQLPSKEFEHFIITDTDPYMYDTPFCEKSYNKIYICETSVRSGSRFYGKPFLIPFPYRSKIVAPPITPQTTRPLTREIKQITIKKQEEGITKSFLHAMSLFKKYID